jgi:hypothetical protein
VRLLAQDGHVILEGARLDLRDDLGRRLVLAGDADNLDTVLLGERLVVRFGKRLSERAARIAHSQGLGRAGLARNQHLRRSDSCSAQGRSFKKLPTVGETTIHFDPPNCTPTDAERDGFYIFIATQWDAI